MKIFKTWLAVCIPSAILIALSIAVSEGLNRHNLEHAISVWSDVASFAFMIPCGMVAIIGLFRLVARKDAPCFEFGQNLLIVLASSLLSLGFWGAANWAALLGLAVVITALIITLTLREAWQMTPSGHGENEDKEANKETS